MEISSSDRKEAATKVNFRQLISSHPFVLITYSAEWCEPCKWAEPILEEVILNFNGKIILHKIDIDAQPAFAQEQHVLSIPTLALFKNGEEVWRMRGFDTSQNLVRVFEKYI